MLLHPLEDHGAVDKPIRVRRLIVDVRQQVVHELVDGEVLMAVNQHSQPNHTTSKRPQPYLLEQEQHSGRAHTCPQTVLQLLGSLVQESVSLTIGESVIKRVLD